jgi:hypothetical protein
VLELKVKYEKFKQIQLVPKFPSTVNVNVTRDKIKQTANLMKIALERSSSIPELNEILTKLISQIKS